VNPGRHSYRDCDRVLILLLIFSHLSQKNGTVAQEV
jgi:hypothetical protein